MGMYWSALTGESTLGIGDTLAIFQAAGKVLFEMKLLIICVSGEAMWSADIFRYLAGIWSAPVEQSDLKFLSCFSNSQ